MILFDGITHIALVVGQVRDHTRRWKTRCARLENTYMFKGDYATCVQCLAFDGWWNTWKMGL